MAPPLVKGTALLRRRLAGVVFLVVVALLVQLTIALYQKQFTGVALVTLHTDRAGNQLSVHADVKVRGVIVGEVRSIRSQGSGATITLAMRPDRLTYVPRDVQARLLPKTLFGEKEVDLVPPPGGKGPRLRAGDVIGQDRSSTAIETETALNDLLPLLRSLKPERLSVTLNALSEALRNRGDELGANLALNAAYFRRLNPSLPLLAQDNAEFADFTNMVSDASPDLVHLLDNLAFSSRSLVQQRQQLSAFLDSTRDFAASATRIVSTNEHSFIALAGDSRAPLKLYATYSDTYSCMLKTLAYQEIEGERVFGGAQPGLHITIEATKDKGNYVPGDEPKYKDTYDAHCYGLQGKKIIPFPAYRNPQDGYHDDAPPDSPGTGPGHAPAFIGAVYEAPTPLLTPALPPGTTELDALLLEPVLASA